MSDCISYEVIRTKRNGEEEKELFDIREEAEDAFETAASELEPGEYECVELLIMDWYERSGATLDYHSFDD